MLISRLLYFVELPDKLEKLFKVYQYLTFNQNNQTIVVVTSYTG